MNQSINTYIKGKRCLFIPVYSMRDYKTGKYKMMNDGNMARILSKVFSVANDSVDVMIPSIEDIADFEELSNFVAKSGIKVRFIQTGCYGKNANETRKSFKFVTDPKLKLLELCDEYDIIICEPNYLTMYLIERGFEDKLIYWCVASKTSQMCPWFVEEFSDLDKMIAQKVKTAVLTKTQVEYLGGMSFVDSEFYRPELFDYKTIFFPFRLSDQSYHAEFVRDAINELKDEGYNNFKILYTDPNASDVFIDDGTFVKIPSSKDVYLSVLKSKPIIPYLEDSNNVLHISIFEFMYYGCKLIMFENDNINPDGAIMIDNNIESLKKAIKKFL